MYVVEKRETSEMHAFFYLIQLFFHYKMYHQHNNLSEKKNLLSIYMNFRNYANLERQKPLMIISNAPKSRQNTYLKGPNFFFFFFTNVKIPKLYIL